MKTTLLGDVCEVINGGTPDTKNADYWRGDIPWITPKDMGRLKNVNVEATERKITSGGLNNSSAKLIPRNSIILSTRAPIGYLAINVVDMTCNQGCKGIVPSEKLDTKYLYYFLKESVELLQELGSGTTFKEVSSTKLREVAIPVPTVEEQKRIVNKLDEVFVAIDKAKENTEKNLRNVQELFESELEMIFSDLGNTMSIKEFAEVKGGKRVPKGEKLLTEKTNYPYIRVTDFNDYGSVDLNDIRYVSDKVHAQIARYTISSRDLYISIAGTIGKTGVIPPALEGANLTENACKLVFNDEVDNKYIYYFTKTKSFLEQAGLSTRTTAMPKMALVRLKEIEIPVPPLSDQIDLVKKFDKLSTQTQKLQKLYQQKLNDLEELRQSYLRQAFSGGM